MTNKHSGLITFLFTDIEGSTKLAQNFPDKLPAALDMHHSILQKSFEAFNGHIFEIVGDAFCCAFENPEDALNAAVEAQINISKANWEDAVIKVRMGIHSGNAERYEDKYMGYITLARTARIMSAAYGEQILISSNTYELIREYEFNLEKRIEGNKISFRDLGERKLKDLIQPIRLYQILHVDLREDFPPLKTLDARPNNLPVQLTSFIGRENEIIEIKKRFEKVKLLTLIGPGGTGKSRLALQTAADLIDDFENGVWLIELASLNESFQITQAVADVFNLKDEESTSPENNVIRYLKDKKVLLIIDNCEHLIDACAIFAETLLKNSPGLKILATSRTALKCEGELTHKVLTLKHPDPESNLTLLQLTQYEAVRLFIERALAVNPSFRVTNENAPSLAQICLQLDGIPLAIELAAVRTKVLNLEKICERLSDRFKLLTGGKRTALPRQQTLRALIDWSFDLLTDKEKILWRRLSVFTGGWSLNDSENICSDEVLESEDIFESTIELVEKSIILFNDITGKYKMLETIKQYGIEKLKEAEETTDFEKKHLIHYLNLCENAKPEMVGPKTKYWLDVIESEYPNIRSALNKCLEINFFEEGHRIAGALSKFWELRGYFTEARNRLNLLLEKTDGVSDILIANSKRLSGIFATQQGENKIALDFIIESLVIYRKLEDKEGISNTLNVLGLISQDMGDYKKAREFLEESLLIRRELKIEIGLCSTLNSIGLADLNEGNYKTAEKYFEEVLELANRIKDDMYIGIAYNNLAQVFCMEMNYEKAKINFEKGMEVDKRLGNKSGICITLANFGSLALEQKNLEEAKKHFEEGLSIGKEIGFIHGISYSLNGLGQVALAEGDFSNAKKIFLEGLKKSGDFNDIQVSVINLTGLSEIMLKEEKYEVAALLSGAVMSLCRNTGFQKDKNVESILNKILNTVTNTLGEEKANDSVNSGKNMTVQNVIELIESEI